MLLILATSEHLVYWLGDLSQSLVMITCAYYGNSTTSKAGMIFGIFAYLQTDVESA